MTNALKDLHNKNVQYGDPAELNELARKKIEEKRRLAEQGGSVEEQSAQPETAPQPAGSIDDITEKFIILKDIKCVDASGKPFEKHDSIYVMKDVIRNENGTHRSFTPYKAIVHMKEQGLILPSMALSCNILATLYANKADAEIKKVLMQYKDHGSGYGWHAQNTIIDGANNTLIHYPQSSDFPNNGGSDKINQGKTKKFDYDRTGLEHADLENALKNNNMETFNKNLTGLKNPKILVEIGQYFGKTPRFYAPDNSGCAVWLGGNDYSFYIIAFNNLGSNDAARGVFTQRPQGARQK